MRPGAYGRGKYRKPPDDALGGPEIEADQGADRLHRKTAFIAKLPGSRRSPEAADDVRAQVAGRADDFTAEAVPGRSLQEAGPGGGLAKAVGDVSDTAHEGPRNDEAPWAPAATGTDGAQHDGRQGTADPGYEPEYVASQAPRSTQVAAESCHHDNMALPWSVNRTAPRSATLSCPAMSDSTPKEQHIVGQRPDGRAQMTLPESLTGVGAAHVGIDDEMVREKTMIDDDFIAMVRPARAPTLLATTDSL